MSSKNDLSLYEIVELSNGDVALRRAEGEGDPLVSIRFSAESEYFLEDAKFEVAKAMIEAALEAVGEIDHFHEDDFSLEIPPVLH